MMIGNDKLAHSASATKELITIVMALAATNVVSQFIGLPQKNWIRYAVLVSILLSVIRFYHGNVLSIDHHFASDDHGSLWRGVTFFVVLIQSFLFTFVPYFFAQPINLFYLVVAVSALDICWLILSVIWSSKVARHERVWGTLAILGGAGLFITHMFHLDSEKAVVGVLLLTAVLDYGFNWKSLYFPSKVATTTAASV